MAQEKQIKDRWKKLGGALNTGGEIRPTPWLSFGSYWFTSHCSEGEDPIYFYGNQYSDLSIFTQFFAVLTLLKSAGETAGTPRKLSSLSSISAGQVTSSSPRLSPNECCQPLGPRGININAGACDTPKEIYWSFMFIFCPSPQDRCQSSKRVDLPEPQSTLKTNVGPAALLFDWGLTRAYRFFWIDVEEFSRNPPGTKPQWTYFSLRCSARTNSLRTMRLTE